jgi:hypothetical protein
MRSPLAALTLLLASGASLTKAKAVFAHFMASHHIKKL